MDKKISIFIVEDHPIMCEGLASYFAGTGRWELSGKASTLAEAKERLIDIEPDLLLLDIQLKDGWGLDLISWLEQQKTENPKLPVFAVYSVFDDYAHVDAALSMGVKAYVCKERNEEELEAALHIALSGGKYIDETAQAKLQTVKSILKLLSKREKELLSLAKQGLSNKEIAARLGISPRTVEHIIACAYDKTGISSRKELMML